MQSLACLDAWKFGPDLVNARGGKIVIGVGQAPAVVVENVEAGR